MYQTHAMNRYLLYFAALILTAVLPEALPGRTGEVKVITPQQAHKKVMENWSRFRSIMLSDKVELSSARDAFNDVVDAKWDGDLGDFPVLSLAMIEWAVDMGETGHRDVQEWLIGSARELSPLSADVEFALGRYHLGSEINPLTASSHYFAGVKKLEQDFPAAFRLYARLLATPFVFLLIFGIVLVITSVLRYSPLLLHDFGDIFPRERLPAWTRTILLLVVLLIPLAAGLFVWWILAWVLLIFSLYMTGGERTLVYLWLISLLSFNFLVENYGVMAGTRIDEPLQAAIRARNGVPEPGDHQVLKNAMTSGPDGVLFFFLNARLTIKKGRITSASEAEALYKDSLEDERSRQAALNNLAQVYYAAGNMDAVLETLVLADKAGPTRPEIYFNLAQYYRVLNKESESKRYRDRVASLPDGDLSSLSRRAGDKLLLNSCFLPLKVPESLVWQRATRLTPEDAAIISATWQKWAGSIPPPGLPFLMVCLGTLVAMNVTRMIKNRARLAKRCSSCGKPMCMRCHLPSKDPLICSQCYSVFRTHSGVDLQVKMQKRSQVQRYKDRWRRLATLFSIAAPGAGHLLMGSTASGFFFLVFTCLIAGGMLSGLLVWPPPLDLYNSGFAGPDILMVLCYIIFILISVSVLRSQLEKWR